MNREPDVHDSDDLHVVSAGPGNPYSVLTPLRIRVMRSLHDSPSYTSVADSVRLPVEEVRAEVEELVSAGLVVEEEGERRPTFLIVDGVEAQRVSVDAQECGHQLAESLVNRWQGIQLCFERLHLSHEFDFRDMAFLLVGDMVLDTGLLNALARDGTLMPPAPARPRPDYLDARYFSWMIEGDHDQLGKYGQRAVGQFLGTWFLLTFGQYWIHGTPNSARSDFEAVARHELANQEHTCSLARQLGIPAVDREEASLWAEAAVVWTDDLVLVYKQRESKLRQLYGTLRAAQYLPHGFGEFLCWYDHVAYASAIDALAAAGELSIPPDRFTAALWYDDAARAIF